MSSQKNVLLCRIGRVAANTSIERTRQRRAPLMLDVEQHSSERFESDPADYCLTLNVRKQYRPAGRQRWDNYLSRQPAALHHHSADY